jgi:hypothetical protein
MTPAQINLRPQITPTPFNPSGTSPSPPKNTSAVRCFAILTFAAAGMAILISFLPAVGHDQLWCLYVAQRLLHGSKLYSPELLETNPPLIMGMLLLPAALSNLLHLPVTLLFKLGVFLTEIVSALLSLHLLHRLEPNLTPAKLWSLAFAFITVFAILPARDLGQRDHLLAILCLPYVIAAALDVRTTTKPGAPRLDSETWDSRLYLKISIGLLAGLGISLKPHHILIPVFIETALIIKNRSLRQLLRPDLIALIATGLAFLATVRIITPAYLNEVVPLLHDVYWAIGHLTFPQLIAESAQLHILAAITLALYLYLKPRPPLPTILILAGSASTIAYYLQGTGWYYQQIPALSFFALALWFLLIELADRLQLRTPSWTPKAALALSILALVLTAYFSGYTLTKPLSFPSGLSNIPDPSFFSNLPPGTPVAILSTVVDDTIPPIVTHHLLWAQRTNNLWALPAILRSEDPLGHPPQRLIPPARLAQLDRMQHAWMVEDLNRWNPPLILVLRCEDPTVQCQILEDRHDNLLAWFQRDPAFRAIFSRYQRLRSSGPYDAYTLK